MRLLTLPAYLVGRLVGWYLERSLDSFLDGAFGEAVEDESPTYGTERRA